MNLREWDRQKIGDYLFAIGGRLKNMSVEAGVAHELLKKLPVRPVWKTYARYELANARRMVLTVLEGIEAMERRYDDEIAVEIEFPHRDDRDDEQLRYETEMKGAEHA